MSTPLDAELNLQLEHLRQEGLYRSLRPVDSAPGPRINIGGREMLNFSSNDYLGLANDEGLKQAAIEAIGKYGAGSGASRLICGSLAPHHELEAALAAFKVTEAALSFSSGYAAALGTICALANRDGVIILDKLVHASIVDAARLSAAKLRVFAHNDCEDLETILRWAAGSGIKGRTLIVTESIFSMDGDCAPLREIVALKEKYGASLMVDEAHATGLYGEHGRGVAEALGVSDRIEIQMGTLGKALGSSGGYIAGSRVLIEYLINRARSFVFSTAPVPAAAAAATAGVRFVQSNEGKARRAILWERVGEFHSGSEAPRLQSAIIPVMIGNENAAMDAAEALRRQDIYVPAIRYPTVARGAARLRVTITAAHSAEDISTLRTNLAPLHGLTAQPTQPAAV
jgi:8-amino-7-oxononanoate synthase